jgi:succinyl-CoA synthetase alpha subunit
VHELPVYDTVDEACLEHQIDASLVSVPPAAAADAALEAIAAGIELVVVTTERMPRRDVACIIEQARDAEVRLIGPNSLGVIVPGATRIGPVGGSAENARRAYTQGSVAVLSRSGGMMTEIAAMLTRAGIGQRICISVGGDAMIGSTFAELYGDLARDPETEAVVVFGEPGGWQEEELASLLSTRSGPPVVAFITGRFTEEIPGVRFGHAAAIVTANAGSPQRKREALADAGALVADRLDQVPELVEAALRGTEA